MDLVVSGTQALGKADLSDLAALSVQFQAASVSENTRKGYKTDWESFSTWCEANGLSSLPASSSTVALYLTSQAQDGYKVGTLGRRLASIRAAHKTMDLPVPSSMELDRTMKGIRNSLGEPPEKAKAITVENMRAITASLPDDPLISLRNRALLLVGFTAGMRRSELVAIDVEHLEFVDEGIILTIPRSKTDQEGKGRLVGIPFGSSPRTCAVTACQHWTQLAELKEGPLFRGMRLTTGSVAQIIDPISRMTGKTVTAVVKREVERIGLDPGVYSAHSLRSGLATAAAKAGADDRSIMAQTGHRSRATLDGYVQRGSLFRDNAAAQVSL